MRAHVNHFISLRKISVNNGATFHSTVLGRGRRLHSDAANVAAARAAPAPVTTHAPEPLIDLLGRHHNYLRISLTERCNLRCQYCMPAEGVPLSARAALLTRSELARAVRTFARLGVDKVRLTGGEPTLRPDLPDIIQDISSVDGINSVSMTTNGLVLTRKLPALQRAGLTAINVSLDSLRPERYERMARRPGLSRVLAGIDLALQLDYRPVKINVVLMKGFNDDEICDFVEFTRDRHVEVRFIEFMPFSGNAWDDSKLVPHRVAVRALTEQYPDALPCLPRPNDTSRVWQVPGFVGRVGFISSMTNAFCSTCNRLRLTADGNLKVCLFGAAEVSLRDAMRGGAGTSELEDMIRTALRNKKPQHAAGLRKAAGGSSSFSHLDAEGGAAGGRAFTARAFSSLTHLDAEGATGRRFSSLTHLDAKGGATGGRVFAARAFSSDSSSVLSHLDAQGHARMVDVGRKGVTARVAEAACVLSVGGRVLRLLRDARLPKGDALCVARVAGVLGAKRTADLIPLCHPLPLECVNVTIQLPKGECAVGGAIAVHCEVRTTAKTGAEMEALTGAATAALTLYDMCKSVDKNMRITDLKVVRKAGGQSGEWPRGPEPEVKVREFNTSPIPPDQAYVPANLMHV